MLTNALLLLSLQKTWVLVLIYGSGQSVFCPNVEDYQDLQVMDLTTGSRSEACKTSYRK